MVKKGPAVVPEVVVATEDVMGVVDKEDPTDTDEDVELELVAGVETAVEDVEVPLEFGGYTMTVPGTVPDGP